MHFTYFDFAVFAIIGLSTILSFFRGIIREMLSLGAWFGAGVVTLYLFPRVAVMLGHSIKNPTLASGFAALITFTLALIAISMISNVFLKFVKDGSDVGLLDHGMGLIFGVARGVLVVAIGYFIFSLAVAKKDFPEAIKTGYTRPFVARAALVVANMAPNYLDELAGTNTKKVIEQTTEPSAKKEITKPDHEVEENVKDAPEINPPSPHEDKTIDWPTTSDLKKRIHDATKENDVR